MREHALILALMAWLDFNRVLNNLIFNEVTKETSKSLF